MNWLTIEVFDGATSGAAWARAWQDSLVEASLSRGAVFWDEHEHRWGVVLEFAFREEEQRDAFRESTLLRAALDTAPDPVNGVLVYPHRGGGTGARQPRRPRPLVQGGAAALPEPDTDAEHVLPCHARLDLATAQDPGAVTTPSRPASRTAAAG